MEKYELSKEDIVKRLLDANERILRATTELSDLIRVLLSELEHKERNCNDGKNGEE